MERRSPMGSDARHKTPSMSRMSAEMGKLDIPGFVKFTLTNGLIQLLNQDARGRNFFHYSSEYIPVIST